MSDIRIPAGALPRAFVGADAGSLTLGSQTVGKAGVLTNLQPDINRARIEHALRHPDAVAAILDKVIGEARACASALALDPKLQACFNLLLGTSYCLLGRSATVKGDERKAAEFFSESVSLFEGSAEEIPEQRNASQLCTDYGIAVFRTGSPQRAIEILLAAEKTGASLPETFHYLARAYRAIAPPTGGEEILNKAADAARKGLQVAPGDPGLYATLAEVQAALHDMDGAVSMYVEAAQAAAKSSLSAASELLAKALQLMPRHHAAVTMAIVVKRAEKDFSGALDLVNSVLRDPPELPWAVAWKGRLMRDLGRPHEAVELYRRVPAEGDTAWVAAELAGALADAGELDAALQAVEKILEHEPADWSTLLLKGRLLIAEQKPQEAVVLLQKMLQTYPGSPEVRYELGHAYFSSGNYPGAVQMFDQALEAAPTLSQAAGAKAMALFQLDDFAGALSQARRALKLKPGDSQMLGLIVDAARKLEREDDALREMEIELARDPQSPRAWYLKGSILLDRGDLDGAVDSLGRAAQFDPGNADVRMSHSNALRLSGRYEEAGRECESALQCEPLTGFALGWAGIYLGEVGEFARACETLARATAASPRVAWFWGCLGWALQYRDDSSAEESRIAYLRAVEEDGKHLNIWNVKGLADALLLCGRNEEAAERLQTLIKEFGNTKDPAVLYVHGWSYYRLGEFAKAAELLKQAADLSTEYIYARFDYALALLADGRMEHARAAYSTALDENAWVHPLRQRGLLYVAMFDIAEGARNKRIQSDPAELLTFLGKRLARVWPDAPKLPWAPAADATSMGRER